MLQKNANKRLVIFGVTLSLLTSCASIQIEKKRRMAFREEVAKMFEIEKQQERENISSKIYETGTHRYAIKMYIGKEADQNRPYMMPLDAPEGYKISSRQREVEISPDGPQILVDIVVYENTEPVILTSYYDEISKEYSYTTFGIPISKIIEEPPAKTL